MTTFNKGYKHSGKTHRMRMVAASERVKDRTPYKRNRPQEIAQARAMASFAINLICVTFYAILAFGLGLFTIENWGDPVMTLSAIACWVILIMALIVPGVRALLADVRRIWAAD